MYPIDVSTYTQNKVKFDQQFSGGFYTTSKYWQRKRLKET